MFDYRETLRAAIHHDFNDFSSDCDAGQPGGVLNSLGLHISRRFRFSACVGRNKRSALRRMGTDGAGVAGSRRITLR
jgi:hypothetical protein